ncbi:acetyl-CoA synthetase-like protein [Meira miltonrushii]|uniref:Acetyl-CoA synthetase-like protein n=1 Tax=Meira miltonrushii TaxID=1280837 RepID=A0A316V4T6_9BASI|nr:acetyl-CoA synthetase-like protein [Meira miltonrushii]PWN32579.1 acetyl-CoA synthetase-like protein [Meira miltonrushii]
MAPTARELFGPLDPIPVEQLANDEEITRKLTVAGSPYELQQKYINGRLQTVYKDLPQSIRQFWLSNVELYGKRTYIVFDDQRYTYADIHQQALRMASILATQFQVRKGDRVGIACRNYPEFVISFWAIHLLGAVTAILNSFHDGETLTFSIKDVSCRAVICDGERFERIKDHLPSILQSNETPFAGAIVMPWMGAKHIQQEQDKKWLQFNGKGNHLIYDWQNLMNAHKNTTPTLPPVDISPDDNGVILFTSGTTGKPKGVLSTQRQHLSCLRLATFGTARALLRRHRPLPPPPDVNDPEPGSVLVLVPLTHTTGLQSGLILSTAAGGKVVLMATYNRDKSIQIAQRERVRHILGIGFMVREIGIAGQDKLPSVSSIAHGGSSSSKELPSELRKSHPNAISSAGYGLTEVNGVALGLGVDDYHARPSSAGVPPVGVEVIIVDPASMERVKDGEQGELWIRSPGRAQGYWNRSKDTAEAFLPDGWFRSGDLAVVDPKDGFFYIVDRLKEIIVRKGENISCGQVENAVYSHPGVLHCAAVAIPDGSGGETVAVVCTPKDGQQLPTPEEVIEQASKHLPKYAVPEFVWIRKEELERNPNGKIVRAAVRKATIEHMNSLKIGKAKL